jgi:hypothetical protein
MTPSAAITNLAPEDRAAWAALLARLIDEAQTALRTGDVRQRLRAQEALIDFTRHCDPVKLADLHRLANGSASDLFRATVDAALRSLAARSQQLAQLTAALQAPTDAARSAESRIRLSAALRTIQALRHAVDASQELRQALAADPAGADLAAAIDATLSQLTDLSTRIRSAVDARP